MKILFATRGLFPYFYGGACKQSFFLIKYLSKFPCKIDVISPIDREHSLKSFFEDTLNIEEFHLEKGRHIYSYSANIANFVSGRDYDIAYSDGFALSRLLVNRNFPIILNRHGFHWLQKQYYINFLKFDSINALKEMLLILPRRILENNYVKKFDYIISEGGNLTNLIAKKLKVPSEKIIIMHNGVDISFISNNKHSNYKRIKNSYLFVGGLQYRKGLYYLIKAFEKLDDSFQLYIIGKGISESVMGSVYRKNIKKNTSNINFLGFVQDNELVNWYNKVQCLILPSLAEGLPTVILEAMANRLPIIASDIGAISAVVRPQNGFLVRPADIRSLRNSIIRFSRLSEEDKNSMGEASRRIVESEFTWDKITKKFYKDLCSIIRYK